MMGLEAPPGLWDPRSMASVAVATLPGEDTCCLAVDVGAGLGQVSNLSPLPTPSPCRSKGWTAAEHPAKME